MHTILFYGIFRSKNKNHNKTIQLLTYVIFMIDRVILDQIAEFFAQHSSFLLLGPKNIDGDTIGTNVALAMYIEEQLGKKAILYSPYPIDEKFLFLPWTDRFVHTFDPATIDAIWTSDTAVPHLFAKTNEEVTLFARSLPWVNLDHHISNTSYGTINAIDVTSTSCSMMLHQVLGHVGGKITPAMAGHMLMSIYTDSGGFIHPNTTPRTYEVAAELLEAGAAQAQIAEELFRKNSVSKLKLWGRVMHRMYMKDAETLVSFVNTQDYAETGAGKEDLDGLVDLMNTADNRVCMLLSEDGLGNVKGSFRTHSEDVDVNAIAGEFGGGGHKLAAGFTLRDRHLEPVTRWKVV